MAAYVRPTKNNNNYIDEGIGLFYRFYIFNINIYTYYIIALFISSNMLPLSLTDTDGFHKMFRRANPTYQVPSSYKIKINLQDYIKWVV